MSAFCVYGYTRQLAMKKARKTVDTWDKEAKRTIDPQEWEARVQEEAERLFHKAKRTKVSNTFSAPAFAAEFIKLGERSGDLRGGTVYAHMETDKVSKKTGKPLLKWKPWTDRALEGK